MSTNPAAAALETDQALVPAPNSVALETADYIGDMAEQLAHLAQQARLPIAAHYLAIAAAETRRYMMLAQRGAR